MRRSRTGERERDGRKKREKGLSVTSGFFETGESGKSTRWREEWEAAASTEAEAVRLDLRCTIPGTRYRRATGDECHCHIHRGSTGRPDRIQMIGGGE